jgi:hypothetical protein
MADLKKFCPHCGVLARPVMEGVEITYRCGNCGWTTLDPTRTRISLRNYRIIKRESIDFLVNAASEADVKRAFFIYLKKVRPLENEPSIDIAKMRSDLCGIESFDDFARRRIRMALIPIATSPYFDWMQIRRLMTNAGAENLDRHAVTEVMVALEDRAREVVSAAKYLSRQLSAEISKEMIERLWDKKRPYRQSEPAPEDVLLEGTSFFVPNIAIDAESIRGWCKSRFKDETLGDAEIVRKIKVYCEECLKMNETLTDLEYKEQEETVMRGVLEKIKLYYPFAFTPVRKKISQSPTVSSVPQNEQRAQSEKTNPPESRESPPPITSVDLIQDQIQQQVEETKSLEAEKGRVDESLGEVGLPVKTITLRFNAPKRSDEIKQYAADRAKDRCELCEEKVFITKNNEFGFEIHHMDELHGGGKDKFWNVAAVCSNCHARIHRGVDGEARNNILRSIILDKERRLGHLS